MPRRRQNTADPEGIDCHGLHGSTGVKMNLFPGQKNGPPDGDPFVLTGVLAISCW